MHYIEWLKLRVEDMHRLLKPTGSIYLHCDWHADAYIRVHILDRIFGDNNFRNHITWQRTNAHNDARKKMPNLCDTIYYYSKSNKHEYKAQFVELSEKYIEDFYKYEDEKGKFRLGDLTGPRINPQDPEWKGYHPSKSGRSWGVPNNIIEEIVGEQVCKTLSTIEKLRILDENNYLYYSKNNIPSVKRYISKSNGVVVGDIWTDIKPVQSQANEKIGYPTQKPEKLLERIILASSNEGDVVFDPFVGGGTTVAVADKLGRKWIGIDQSVQAIKVSEYRLNKQQDLFSQPFFVQLHKYDYDTLKNKDAFEFESWIITQFGIKMGISAYPQNKKGGDHGFDGKLKDGTPIQVKRSDNIGVNVAKNFLSSCHINEPALYSKRKESGEPIGYIIAFSFGKGTIEAVAKIKSELGVNIQLVKVEEIVPIAKKPKLTVTITDLGNGSTVETIHENRDTVETVHELSLPKENKKTALREIQFTALAESEAGIEMYAWDWDYEEDKPFKAEIILDKSGTQTMKFKPGNHTIAVKAEDNDGLEAIEIIKIKVNGVVVERG